MTNLAENIPCDHASNDFDDGHIHVGAERAALMMPGDEVVPNEWHLDLTRVNLTSETGEVIEGTYDPGAYIIGVNLETGSVQVGTLDGKPIVDRVALARSAKSLHGEPVERFRAERDPSIKDVAVTSIARRPQSSRAPKRRAAKHAAAQSAATSGADGPPPPEDPPRRRAGQEGPSSPVGATILAILVDQRSAGRLLGWSARRFIDFVRRKDVPHVVDARLFIAKLDDILAALGLAPPAAKVKEPAVDWRARAELRLVAGSRGGR